MTKRKLQLAFALSIVVVLMLVISLTPVTTASSPYLKKVKEYYYAPLLDSNPRGRLNLIVDISKVKSDGVPNYDWYFYSAKIQTVPGTVAYGSNWRTDHTWAHNVVWIPGTNRWLVDYDPTTTVGQTTVTVSLTAIPLSFGTSWSYSVSDVAVYDKSDFSQHRAYWEHDIDATKPAGIYTYLARPGFVVKTLQNYWSFVDAQYEVLFAKPGLFWEHWKLTSPTLYLDAQESGD